MKPNPFLLEVNTSLLVKRGTPSSCNPLSLLEIPDSYWQQCADQGFNLIWLMGLWERSPRSAQIAREHPDLAKDYDTLLGKWTPDDIQGSPYAIRQYELHPAFGKTTDLRQLRNRLHRLNLGLIVDFVPNHVALDHPWVTDHPEFFFQGNDETRQQNGASFFVAGEKYLAHGKDPHFPPWTDTAQFNYFSPQMREALVEELQKIAQYADGVRCDMAMLALNSVFKKGWAWLSPQTKMPEGEFWQQAVSTTKKQFPDFLFLAECYWNLEDRLIELGFDYAYDKALYDQMKSSDVDGIRRHLRSQLSHKVHAAHFIENHDEERALTVFGRERSKAAAVAIATLPGLRLFHEGQSEGKLKRIPVQLAREPEDQTDPDLRSFYKELHQVCRHPVFQEGNCTLLKAAPLDKADSSSQNILAWQWLDQENYRVVVINYSDHKAKGQIDLPNNSSNTALAFYPELYSGTPKFLSTLKENVTSLSFHLEPWGYLLLKNSP